MNTSSSIRDKAPLILEEIKKAKSVLLHCHPSPDPDSVGSALAMKFALEQLGKKATIILGDAVCLPEGFLHFPGAGEIQTKSYSEIDPKEFDLFIVLDCGSIDRISAKRPPQSPLPIRSINIDHHKSNTLFGDVNLVETCVSTTYILYHLFNIWGIQIDHDIAANLFIGMYTDSGGFKYSPIDSSVFEVVAELVKSVPDFVDVIFAMENSQTKEAIYFEALALNSIKTYLDGNVAIASVSSDQIRQKGIVLDTIHTDIPNRIKSVIGWNIGMLFTEIGSGDIKVSMRSRDTERFDVSRLAVALGGGGHRAAAGVRIQGLGLDEAISKVVATAKDLYNL